jgi:hypothetical protein
MHEKGSGQQQQKLVVQVHQREETGFHSVGVLHVDGDEEVPVMVENACQNGNAVCLDVSSHS